MSASTMHSAETDRSSGWDAAADLLVHDRARSRVGIAVLREWARALPPGASVLDLGCGAGVPVSSTLDELGYRLWAIDGSPRLVAAYQERFPDAPVTCEAAEASRFFGRTFDAIVSIGLLFLLDEAAQRAVIRRVAAALAPDGRALLTTPWQTATWIDPTTKLWCRSLGRAEITAAFARAGLGVDATPIDEGENHYFSLRRMG